MIETKNYSGFVKCVGDNWFVGSKKIHSLSKQAKRNAVSVRENLEGVFKIKKLVSHTSLPCWCSWAANAACLSETQRFTFFVRHNWPKFIARCNSAKAPSITLPELRRAIVHHLHLLQQKPDKWVVNR